MQFRRAVHVLASVLIVIAVARLIVVRQRSNERNPPVDAHQQSVLRVYDVRDIWQPLVEQLELHARAEAAAPKPRPQIDYGPNETPIYDPPGPTTVPVQGLFRGSGGLIISAASRQEATDRITAMLEREITPDDWYDNGGRIATMRADGGFLLIWHTPAGHRKIEEMLTAIRRADRIRWQESGAVAKQ